MINLLKKLEAMVDTKLENKNFKKLLNEGTLIINTDDENYNIPFSSYFNNNSFLFDIASLNINKDIVVILKTNKVTKYLNTRVETVFSIHDAANNLSKKYYL